MQANSITEVIAALDIIISDCKQKQSRLGYFAVLYKMMTVAVEKGIRENVFADGQRMEKLDVVFANRYLKAYFDHAANLSVTGAWKSAFTAAEEDDLIVVQHLLLGINAHINLDLGIAAAEISTPANINDLLEDFNKINLTISDVYEFLQSRFKEISWPAIFLGKIDPQITNSVINFSIGKARDMAWNNALLLCNAGLTNRETIINTTDKVVCKVASAIQQPSFLKRTLVKLVLFFEEKNVAKNIEVLSRK